ncbi:universal stress protein [Maribacter sp. 2304DJ31-5]|uniref:universal stress protein n=1 Tax=Maribacter sp. 2304DJ31-5 TaxID=3386273 RepID=UPI0039BCF3AD
MDKIFRILVPFDFSEVAKEGLEYAVGFVGNRNDIEIMLCYVTEARDMEDLKSAFDKKQALYINNLELPMSWVVQEGSLNASILKIRETKNVDLIIMGTSGIKHFDNANTHTSELVLEADCPVLVVPHGNKGFKLENIALVLGPDKIEDSSILSSLLEIARRFNAKVHVLTIEKEGDTYGYSEVDEKNEDMLQYYLENFYKDHTLIKNEDLVEGVFSFAIKNNIDLISILPRNHSKISIPSSGSLTRELTVNSEIPILAIE